LKSILFSLASAAVALAGPSGAPTKDDDDVYDFTGPLVYQQNVFAPDPKTGCPIPPGPVEMKWLPCEADTYEEMCNYQAKRIKDNAAKTAAALKPYTDAAKAAHERIELEIAAKYGAKPDAKNEKKAAALRNELSRKYLVPINDQVARGLEPTRPNVMRTINDIRDTMRAALASAPKVSPYNFMLQAILGCDIKLTLNTEQVRLNSWMTSGHDDQGLDILKDEVETGSDVTLVARRSHKARVSGDNTLVNPLEQAGYHCKIELSPSMWVECAEARPSCIYYLFHEFGHTLNSCNFYRINQQAKERYEEEKGATVDSRKNNAVYAKFLADESLDFARTLVGATSCLTLLSSPENAVLNTCSPPTLVTEEYNQRCGVTATDGYPAQWTEAEADFWAATGIAQWLGDSKRYPTEFQRMDAFYAMWSENCALAGDLADLSWDLAPPITPPDTEKVAAGPGKTKACKDTPRKPTKSDPWKDPHQGDGWRERANRNFMRNSDLRKALGCPDRDPHIPLTCSPIH
jgi:hypothetical protein